MASAMQKQEISRVLQESMLSLCQRIVPFRESLELHGLLQLEADGEDFCTVSFKNVRSSGRQDGEDTSQGADGPGNIARSVVKDFVTNWQAEDSGTVDGGDTVKATKHARDSNQLGKSQPSRKNWDPFGMVKHKKNVAGKYECLICGREFSHGTNLTRHQRSRHGRPQTRKALSPTCTQSPGKARKQTKDISVSEQSSSNDRSLELNNNQDKHNTWSLDDFDNSIDHDLNLHADDGSAMGGVDQNLELNQSQSPALNAPENRGESEQNAQTLDNLQGNLSETLWDHFSRATSENLTTSSSSTVYCSVSLSKTSEMADSSTTTFPVPLSQANTDITQGPQVPSFMPEQGTIPSHISTGTSGQSANKNSRDDPNVTHTDPSPVDVLTSTPAATGHTSTNLRLTDIGNSQPDKGSTPESAPHGTDSQIVQIVSSGHVQKYVKVLDSTAANMQPSKYRCPKCDQRFDFFRNLGRHARMKHKMSVLELGEMNDMEVESAVREKHVCDICQRSFKHLPNLYRHKTNLHGVKFRKQNASTVSTDTVSKKLTHDVDKKTNSQTQKKRSESPVSEASKSDRHVCELCSNKFSCSSSLTRHMRRSHKLVRVDSKASPTKPRRTSTGKGQPKTSLKSSGSQKNDTVLSSKVPPNTKSSTLSLPVPSSADGNLTGVTGRDEPSSHLQSTEQNLEVLQNACLSELSSCAQTSKNQHTLESNPSMCYPGVWAKPLAIQPQVENHKGEPSQSSTQQEQRRSLPLSTTDVDGTLHNTYHTGSTTVSMGKPNTSKRNRNKNPNRNSDPLPVRPPPHQILPQNVPQSSFQADNLGMVQRTPYRTVSEHDIFAPVPAFLPNSASRYGTLPVTGGIRPMEGTPSVAVSQGPYTGKELAPAENHTFMYPSTTSLPETWTAQPPYQQQKLQTGNLPQARGDKSKKKDAKSKSQETKPRSKEAKSRSKGAKSKDKEAGSNKVDLISNTKQGKSKNQCTRCGKSFPHRSNFTRHMRKIHNTVPDC